MRVPLMIGAVLASLTATSASAQQVAELQAPAAVTLAVGQRQEILVSAFSASGDFLSNVRYSWSGGDASIARVDSDPAVQDVFFLVGVGAGVTTWQLRGGGKAHDVEVTVTGGAMNVGEGAATKLEVEPADTKLFPFEERQMEVSFLKDDGSYAAFSPVTWNSLVPSVASVDASGLVVAITTGATAIEARTASGLVDRVRVEVIEADWTFEQPRYSIAPLESDTLRIVVPSQNNRRLDLRQFDGIRSLNPSTVAVSLTGVITAVSPGSTEIVAQGFGREQRVSVTVHPEVDEIRVVPSSSGEVLVPLGGAVAFRATPVSAAGQPIPEAVILWAVGDTSVATFDDDSLMLHGHTVGTTELSIVAPSGFESYRWSVRVAATGLVTDRSRLGLSLGGSDTLTASFADTMGLPLGPAREVTWTSLDPGVAAVTAAGVVQPRGFGRARIEASTPWGVADTAVVFVQGDVLVTSTRSGSAALYAFDRSSPENMIQITAGPGNDMAGSFSPDGGRVVFTSSRNGSFDLFVADADGGNPVQVTSAPGNEAEPVWAADGERIVYQSEAGGTLQIWIVNADGTGARELTQGQPSLEPAVSPDGSKVAYTSPREGNYDIFVLDLGTGAEENVTQSGAGTHERVPAWIDDHTLAYVREDRQGRTNSWRVMRHPLGGSPMPLTDTTLVVSDFAVATDGTLALAVSEQADRGTLRRLYLLGPRGGVPVLVPPASDQDQMARPAFRR